MFETILALGVGAVLWAVSAASPMTAAMVGLVGALTGVVGGTVAGVFYHVTLERQLRGQLPARWWLNPMAHHDVLTESQWRAVVPWFISGVASFFACMLGLLFAAGAVLKVL